MATKGFLFDVSYHKKFGGVLSGKCDKQGKPLLHCLLNVSYKEISIVIHCEVQNKQSER